MKRIWLAVCFVLLPIASVGQTVTVRGGEHDGFTRLVLDCLTSAPMGPNGGNC